MSSILHTEDTEDPSFSRYIHTQSKGDEALIACEPTDTTPIAHSPQSNNTAAPQEHSPQEHSPQDLAPSYPDTSDGQHNESELINQMVVHHDPSTAAPTCQPSAHTIWPADWGYAALEKGIEPQAGTLAPGPGIMYAQIPRPIFETYVPNTKSISNAAIFAQQVYFAAGRVLTGASSNGPVLSTEANESHLPGYMVNEIAATAVEVIGSLAGLNTYIYGVVGFLNSYDIVVFRTLVPLLANMSCRDSQALWSRSCDGA